MYQRCIGIRPGAAMAWKATAAPTVRKQRDKWVVRVDGIDTETGRHRPRQLGTYRSQRAASAAAREALSEDRASERGTVSWLVHRYVTSRTDISVKAREQYEWAATHIDTGLGAVRVDQLEREDHRSMAERPGVGREALSSEHPGLPQRPPSSSRRCRRRGTAPPEPSGTRCSAA